MKLFQNKHERRIRAKIKDLWLDYSEDNKKEQSAQSMRDKAQFYCAKAETLKAIHVLESLL